MQAKKTLRQIPGNGVFKDKGARHFWSLRCFQGKISNLAKIGLQYVTATDVFAVLARNCEEICC
jgi:hypothetical protein